MEHRIRYFRLRAFRALPLLLVAAFLLVPGVVLARVTDDTIVLGAAVSLTGRYTTAGHHTRNGYELAVNMINERGGVVAGGQGRTGWRSSTTTTSRRRPAAPSWQSV